MGSLDSWEDGLLAGAWIGVRGERRVMSMLMMMSMVRMVLTMIDDPGDDDGVGGEGW